MNRLRWLISALAALAFAVALTRMMQNPTMWNLLERPVLAMAEALNVHGHENVEDIFIYITVALAFLVGFLVVALANRLLIGRVRR